MNVTYNYFLGIRQGRNKNKDNYISKPQPLPKTRKMVGVDMIMISFCATSAHYEKLKKSQGMKDSGDWKEAKQWLANKWE